MFMSFNARGVGLDLPVEETLSLAAAAGFGGVDLLVRDLVDSGASPRTLRARMDDLGLRGGAWPLPVSWRGEAGPFARDLQRLPRHAEAAAVLGLLRTGTWVLPETPGRPDPARVEPDSESESEAAYLASVAALHVERLGAIARVLAEHGVRFGLEVIGVESSRTGRGLPFVTRLGDLGGLLEALSAQAPNVGVLVDGFHLFAAGERVEVGLAWGVDRVVWVHVADLPASVVQPDRRTMRDADRGLPGENGAVPNAALLATLDEAGYDGPVTAEPMAACRTLAGLSPGEVAHRVAAALRSVWPDRSG